jgi:glycosyltransferase involved in cell wall biosynthesis
MPHVIAEAGAARLPVVATCDNGTAEQITDGETGLFVPSENPEAAAQAIIRLVNDKTLRRTLGEKLYHKVNGEYSTATVIPRWQALFEELTSREVARHLG